MSFFRHEQIYQSDMFFCQGRSCFQPRPRAHRLMSLQPAIPRWVALQRCPPPFHQPLVIMNPIAGTVNHHFSRAGEFSTGILGNFQPELTQLREQLTRYYPQMLHLGSVVDDPWIWDLLELAPTPQQGHELSAARAEALLRGHRIRRISSADIMGQLGVAQLRLAPGAMEAASLSSLK
jgi:hypothetical protein